ncbi:hypothetical protein RBU49_08975 [Clostridium sp. MB40-C1]|uniref:hypothetical protein n=1 Tax=Clostridium sp. MB40-C1 TaxID=3070996 RepID=UPI0027E1B0B5|nr:hypothetical protein [Clostridium sp. MB40-C1]WMJ82363.1 hypothetical protein RBU49_08975 [Clostridium sp. MB40-C1]
MMKKYTYNVSLGKMELNPIKLKKLLLRHIQINNRNEVSDINDCGALFLFKFNI